MFVYGHGKKWLHPPGDKKHLEGVSVNVDMLDTNQENISAKLQDAVHTGQLLKHDGVGNLTEEATHKLPNDQDHRHVQTHDTGRRGWNQGVKRTEILTKDCQLIIFSKLHFYTTST